MEFWDGSGISWTICKQSAPHSIQITTSTLHHWIFTGRMLFLTPNQQCQSNLIKLLLIKYVYMSQVCKPLTIRFLFLHSFMYVVLALTICESISTNVFTAIHYSVQNTQWVTSYSAEIKVKTLVWYLVYMQNMLNHISDQTSHLIGKHTQPFNSPLSGTSVLWRC